MEKKSVKDEKIEITKEVVGDTNKDILQAIIDIHARIDRIILAIDKSRSVRGL